MDKMVLLTIIKIIIIKFVNTFLQIFCSASHLSFFRGVCEMKNTKKINLSMTLLNQPIIFDRGGLPLRKTIHEPITI